MMDPTLVSPGASETRTKVDPGSADAETRRGWGRPRLQAWPLVLASTLVVIGVIPLFWVSRYYFRGDTQIAYLGWWYHLGEQVRAGHLPLMEPLAWEAGNYVAEGQWGLFSPLTILIGCLATIVPNVVVFVTVLKIGLIVTGGLGASLLARSYGAGRPFAMVAGLVVGLSGEAVFLDWPSWVNGQIGVALLPWAWWFVRRAMAGRNPVAALLLCYLVVTVGYVYCAMYLAVILLGCLVDAALSRSLRTLLTTLGLSLFSGLVTLAVYLPGVLTSPVTVRDSWSVTGPGRMTMDVQQAFASMLPEPNANYLLWLLPAVLWMDLGRLRRTSRDLAGALVATLALLMWVLGPATVGPLRWPVRVVPALMVPLVVLLAVVASRCLMGRVSRLRLVLSLGWVGAAAYVVVARDPGHLKGVLAGMVLVSLALALTAWSIGRRGARTTVAVVVASTLALFVVQHAAHPQPPAVDRHMPAQAAAYADRITSAWGDVMVLGNADYYEKSQIVRNPAIADDLLIAASWYLSPKDVQNGYTTISYRTFREKFCRVFNGGTCAGALKTLLSTEPTTGRKWVDLLSVSTLVLYRPFFAKTNLEDPPGGWSVSERTPYTVVWKRDVRLPTAGGVVATTAGLALDQEQLSDRQVRLRVDKVGPRGGTLTLSRLAWPGYSVKGGELADPVDGMLVRVKVPAGSAGSTIVVKWDPPGWKLEMWALWTAILGALVWAALAGLGRARRRMSKAPLETQ